MMYKLLKDERHGKEQQTQSYLDEFHKVTTITNNHQHITEKQNGTT